MRLLNMLPYRRNIAIGLALWSIQQASAAQTYCSSQNTGSGFSAVTDIYQSNGACHDTCNGQGYAFAVVQYQKCWCSNYAPANQVSVGQCSQDCPGYPAEQCGNQGSGLFGYIKLDKAASGTAGAVASSTSQSPSSTPQSSTDEPETSYVSVSVVKTVTQTPDASVSVSFVTPIPTPTTSTSPSSTSSTTSMSTSSTPPTTTSVTPVTSLVLTTISGDVVTQTVTSTPIVAPGSHPDSIQLQRKDGLGGGAIAGIVIGVLAGVALLALAAFLLWRRRRSDDDAENNTGAGAGAGAVASGKKSPRRNVSVLSKAGLLARARPSMGERDHDDHFYVTPATGANSVRHSMLFSGNDGVNPVSPLDSSASGGTRRGSKPMVYDQRLNPSALFANQEANGSRISMQDTQDYSRPLGVMNPDPRESFESRMSRA